MEAELSVLQERYPTVRITGLRRAAAPASYTMKHPQWKNYVVNCTVRHYEGTSDYVWGVNGVEDLENYIEMVLAAFAADVLRGK